MGSDCTSWRRLHRSSDGQSVVLGAFIYSMLILAPDASGYLWLIPEDTQFSGSGSSGSSSLLLHNLYLHLRSSTHLSARTTTPEHNRTTTAALRARTVSCNCYFLWFVRLGRRHTTREGGREDGDPPRGEQRRIYSTRCA